MWWQWLITAVCALAAMGLGYLAGHTARMAAAARSGAGKLASDLRRNGGLQ